MLILGHHQNNKMNLMTTFAWCKRGNGHYDHNCSVVSCQMFESKYLQEIYFSKYLRGTAPYQK